MNPIGEKTIAKEQTPIQTELKPLSATANIEALFAPRNIVLVGASDHNWSARVHGNLSRLGYPGKVYLVNPNRSELWEQTCYPALSALPEPPDHLAVFLPAEQTIETIEAAGGLGARSASLFAAGFGEGGDPAGRDRAARLRNALNRCRIAAVGPNCMGLSVGRSKFATIPDEHLNIVQHGSVALVAQSGMLMQTLSRGIESGGASLSYQISCGNQIGLTFADYILHLSSDDDVRVIACYIEAIPEVPAFFEAVRKARQNGKTVVVTKIGGSENSRRAALAHTGSLSGSLQAFDVFAREEGIVRAETIEDLVESCIFLSRAPRPRGRKIGLITNSGALKALATETGEALNVSFAELSRTTGGAITAAVPDLDVSNPLDTKRTLSTEQYIATVEAVHDDPAVDMVLIAEELPRAAGIDRKVKNFWALDAYIATRASKPIVCFSPVTCADNQYMTSLRRELPRIAWLRDLNKTLRVASRLAPAGDPPLAASHLHASDGLRQSLMRMAATHHDPFALNEQVSKKILGEFGIRTPREAFVERMDVEEAARAGRDIGFPVVLKVVSAAVTHKSDVGLVLLNLSSEADLRQAVQLLSERCDALGVSAEGLLIAQQIAGGVEVIIGLHRDPEMGPVVMFGSGGIFLELFRDVAFGPPGLDDARARNMILSTRVADLIKGYRGSEPSDLEALVGALKAMGALAIELGDLLESAEINPLIVRADGVYALDALLVVAGNKLRSSGPTLESSG
jgi:acyl-CoA synthetase (NDP forming)